MDRSRSWTAVPVVGDAVVQGDYGTVFRAARTAAGLTLQQIGRRAGYSAATLSRLEGGRRRVRDLDELRRWALVYDIPPHVFGLAAQPGDPNGSTLSGNPDGEGEHVQRRNFVTAIAAAGVVVTLPGKPEIAGSPGSSTLDDVLFGRVLAEPVSTQHLATQLAAARDDFRATRYTQLAARLPHLLARAQATHAADDVGEQEKSARLLAQAYGVATQLLLKLHDGLAAVTADRGVHAATTSGDPLLLAESQRLAATVLRRLDHRSAAQTLSLRAADQLRATTRLTDSAQQASFGQLLAVAAYTAAMRDDRDTASTLLNDAVPAARAAGGSLRFNRTELAVYRVSIAQQLGDYGQAIDDARQIDPRSITIAERRARYRQDLALAQHGRGHHDAAYETLRDAARDLPEDVRHRPWAQQLTQSLLASPTARSLPGLREFATHHGLA